MERHRPDYSALEDRAKEAESLLGHKIFGAAVAELRRSLVLQMLACPMNDPKLLIIHGKAKLLDELVGELKSIANEIKIARRPEGT